MTAGPSLYWNLDVAHTVGIVTGSGSVTFVLTKNPSTGNTSQWAAQLFCQPSGGGTISGTGQTVGNATGTSTAPTTATCPAGSVIFSLQVGTGGTTAPAPRLETWKPSGAGAQPDPAVVPRYIDSQITCKSPGGGSQVLTRRDGPVSFDPAGPATMPEVPDMVCPEGTWLSNGGRSLHTEGADPSTDVPIQQPYEAPPWVEEQVNQFPECLPVGSQTCLLKLFRVQTEAHPEYDCFAYPAGPSNPCEQWSTDPNRRAKYECRFGSNVLTLRHCTPYAEAFATETPTITPTPSAEPEDPIATVDPTPEQTPELGDCVPSWGELLTPWWVFKAQACALRWAFVPDTQTWGLAELRDQLLARPPASVVIGAGGVLSSVAQSFSNAAGCGLLADFSSSGTGGIDAPITCQGVRDSIPAFGVWYTLVQVAIWIGFGIYVWRYLSGLFERGN
jgi:hypothetical protein